MKIRFSLALAAASCLALAGTAVAQQPMVIKFSHVVAENTPKGQGRTRITFSFPVMNRSPLLGSGRQTITWTLPAARF
jgi:hypothetical protein